MLAPSTTEGGAPMQKYHCGMVHFTDGEEDLLYVVGGWVMLPHHHHNMEHSINH